MITVIIPFLNSEKTISKCVLSVLNQTFADFELILIDDGSEDKSLDICKKFAKKDNRIRIIEGRKAGVSSARNIGLKLAKGKFICFVDSDDWLDINALNVLYKRINETESDICFGAYCLEYGDKTKTVKEEKLYKLCNNPKDISNIIISEKFDEDDKKLVRDNVAGYVWRILFRKEKINSLNLAFEERLHFSEDRVFLLNFLTFTEKASYVCDVVYHYNKCIQDSASNVLASNYRIHFFEERQELLNCLECVIKKSSLLDSKKQRDLLLYVRYKFAYEILQNAIKTNKKDAVIQLKNEMPKETINNLITKESFQLMKQMGYSFKKIFIFKLIKYRKWRILVGILKHE